MVLTAYDYSSIEEEAREAGVNEFITKPLFRSRLTTALRNIAAGRSAHPEEDSLSDLRKSNQQEPVKPFRSYYDKDGDAR